MENLFNIDSFDFIWSDQHFNHDNIVKYSMRPGYDPRGFGHDFEKHNALMLENAHRFIRPGDKVLNLGDIAMGKREDAKLLGELPGDNYLILGNHDKWGQKFYEDLGITVILPFKFQQEGAFDVSFTHYPRRQLRGNEINIHGHIHNNPCDFLTRRHNNMSVEVIGYQPLPFKKVVENALYNAKNPSDMNFRELEWNKAKRNEPLFK